MLMCVIVVKLWSNFVCNCTRLSDTCMSIRGIYLGLSDIGCQYFMSIYTARFIVWQPRCVAETSTNWRQSLFCCCTASMEPAADGAETAAIDGLVSLQSENISVWFCLQATRYGLTLWCGLGLLVGSVIEVPQLQLRGRRNQDFLLRVCNHISVDSFSGSRFEVPKRWIFSLAVANFNAFFDAKYV